MSQTNRNELLEEARLRRERLVNELRGYTPRSGRMEIMSGLFSATSRNNFLQIGSTTPRIRITENLLTPRNQSRSEVYYNKVTQERMEKIQKERMERMERIESDLKKIQKEQYIVRMQIEKEQIETKKYMRREQFKILRKKVECRFQEMNERKEIMREWYVAMKNIIKEINHENILKQIICRNNAFLHDFYNKIGTTVCIDKSCDICSYNRDKFLITKCCKQYICFNCVYIDANKHNCARCMYCRNILIGEREYNLLLSKHNIENSDDSDCDDNCQEGDWRTVDMISDMGSMGMGGMQIYFPDYHHYGPVRRIVDGLVVRRVVGSGGEF